MSQRKLQPINGGIPEARASPDELAERHLPLVIHIARDFRKRLPSSVDFDDLVGAGNIGLVEAARRFTRTKALPLPPSPGTASEELSRTFCESSIPFPAISADNRKLRSGPFPI